MNNAGQTALHTILSKIRNEDPSVVSLLVEKGFSLEVRDNHGYTALLTLVSQPLVYNVEPFVAELLRLGANARATDYEGRSVLHHVGVSIPSYTDGSREDAEEKLRIMRMVATAGADINAVDHAGNTIFHDIMACANPWYHVHGSMPAAMEMGVPLAKRNHQGRSIVHVAAMVDEHYKSRSENPSYGDFRMAFILNPELDLDVGAVDHEGVTPLHLASTASQLNSWMLVQAGANITARTYGGETPLHFAARSGQCNIVGHLIGLYQSERIPVDLKSLNGRTVLHEAARSGRPESVKLLLDAGADPTLCDGDGRSPLHAAAEFQNQAPALPHDRRKPSISPYEDTPYTAASTLHEMGMIIQSEDDTRDIREVVRLLMNAGSDPARLDNSDYTATDVALMLGTSAVVDALGPAMRSIYSNTSETEGLLPLDPLGESLCSHASMTVATILDTVYIPGKYDDFLKRAISARNEGLVEELVRSTGLSLIQENGTSALCLAARWGLVSMMKKLIPYVEDLSIVYDSLMTAAVIRILPNIEMVKVLLQHRGRQTEFQQSIRTAICTLTRGTYWWYASALTLLLEAGADPNAKDHHGESPLHGALEAASSPGTLRELQPGRMINILLQHNADVNALSDAGLSPLSIAIQNRKTETVLKLLLDHGANPLLGNPPAIFFAIDCLNIRRVKLFLETGTDPMAVFYASEGQHPGKEVQVETHLECAACPVEYDLRKSGTLPRRELLISLLLEYGANPDLSLCEGKSSPLHEISGMNGIVKPLILKGYDLEQRDIDEKTPLLRACKLHQDTHRRAIHQESAAIELIRGGANVHATDNDGFTPLHYASWFGLTGTVKALLQKSASANAKDNRGLTPLYYAFISTRESENESPPKVHHDIVTDLLDAGADPLERAPNGRTALHFIAPCLMDYRFTRGSIKAEDLENRHWPVDLFAKYSRLYLRFVEAGCDREARDSNGNTPIFAYVATDRIFHDEVEMPYPPTVESIRAMFTDHDVRAVNDEGNTLLHVVARRDDEGKAIPGEPGIFELLVEYGLSPWRENKMGATALDTAAMWNRREILAMFSREDDLARSPVTSESGM